MSRLPRVVYAGTSGFAVPPLAALAAAGYAVVAVLTQPDRPAGRGRKPVASPVKEYARQAGVPVWQPERLNGAAAHARLQDYAPDVMIVAAYGLLLPGPVLALPGLGCINVHASLLPRWRGAAPVARALQAGDPVTGVSIMAMVEALDAGPVYLARELRIESGETAGELENRLAELGAAALLEALPGIVEGCLQPGAQDDARATYAPKLNKAEAVLDWSRPATELERQVRAFNPWPVAETVVGGNARLRIWRARAVPANALRSPPGTISKASGDELVVAAGEGALALQAVQWPGKRVVTARECNAGRSLLGERLG